MSPTLAAQAAATGLPTPATASARPGRRLPLMPYPAGSYPAVLRRATLGLAGCGLVAVAGLALAVGEMRSVSRTVVHDSVPSIVAAHRLQASVARLNSAAVESALAEDRNGQASWSQVETERLTSNDVLLAAARNITYGRFEYRGQAFQGERESVLRIGRGLQDYLVAANLAHRSAAPAPQALWDASEAMRDTVLGSARDLGGNNYAHLDADYDGHWQVRILACLALSAAALLSMLGPMRHIRQETGSHSGRAAAGQAVLAAVAVAVGLGLLSDVRALNSAKQDAFDSINVLSAAGALAGDIGSQVALWLLLPDRRGVIETRLDRDASEMERPASGTDKGGLLTQELANITFPGEREAAEATLGDWRAMSAVIRGIVTLVRQGEPRRAADVLLGNQAGGLGLASSVFEGQLGQAVSINQQHFDADRDAIDRSLSLMGWGLPLAGLLGLGLLWSGGMSRERLYL